MTPAISALWYRDGRTEMARDWLIIDAPLARDAFWAWLQTMNGSHYCEGNERFAVDGAAMPQVHGTGTEDYYLACLWPNPNYNKPFAGCVGDITKIPGPACYYRFHLEAPLPFYSALDARIQHGATSDIVFALSHPRVLLSPQAARLAANRFHRRGQRSQRAAAQLPSGRIEIDRRTGSVLRRQTTPGHSSAITAGCIRPARSPSPPPSLPTIPAWRLRRRLDQKFGRQSADVSLTIKRPAHGITPTRTSFCAGPRFRVRPSARVTRGKSELESFRLAIQGRKRLRARFSDFPLRSAVIYRREREPASK